MLITAWRTLVVEIHEPPSGAEGRYRPRVAVVAPTLSSFGGAGGATAVRLSCISFIHTVQSQAWLRGVSLGGAVEMPNGTYTAQNRIMPVSNTSTPTTASTTPGLILLVSRNSPARNNIPPASGARLRQHGQRCDET